MKKGTFISLFAMLLTTGFVACENISKSSDQVDQSMPPLLSLQGNYEPVELPVSSDLIDVIMASFSGRNFKETAVSDDILEAILQSGQKASSAANGQPWHFTVIKNKTIAGQLGLRDYREGVAVIIVSGKPNERMPEINVGFDCGLAAQNMFLAAQSLGLGSRLYYGGVQIINDNLKPSLGIPDDYRAQIVMLAGYLNDDVDAVTSASPRRPLSENVNYIE